MTNLARCRDTTCRVREVRMKSISLRNYVARPSWPKRDS